MRLRTLDAKSVDGPIHAETCLLDFTVSSTLTQVAGFVQPHFLAAARIRSMSSYEVRPALKPSGCVGSTLARYLRYTRYAAVFVVRSFAIRNGSVKTLTPFVTPAPKDPQFVEPAQP